jgi:hypothetical protein
MNLVNMPFREVATFCIRDVLSTELLFWSAVAALGFVRRFSRALFALVFSVSVSMSVDRILADLEMWETPWTAGVWVLLLAILLVLVRKSPEETSDPRTRSICLTPLVTGWVMVFLVPAGVGYALARDIPQATRLFSRLAFSTALVVFLFTALTKKKAARLYGKLASGAAILVGVMLLYRVILWGTIWTGSRYAETDHRIESAAPVLTGSFPRLEAFLEVDRSFACLERDPVGAVRHLRVAGLFVESEWLSERVSMGSGYPSRFLPIAALGGEVDLEEDERATSLLLDESVPRFLVATDRGRIIALGPRNTLLLRVEFRPISLCLTEGGSFAALGENGELSLLNGSGKAARSDLPKGTYRGLAYDAGSGALLVVRPGGLVIRVFGGESEQFLPAIWAGKDVAADIVTTPDGSGTYVLDVHGGIHPRGKTPIVYTDLKYHDRTVHYWPSLRIGVAVQVTADGFPVYADVYGGIHGILKRGGEVVYAGHDYPPLHRAAVVDCVLSELFSAVYLLTGEGRIIVVPEYGWLRGD